MCNTTNESLSPQGRGQGEGRLRSLQAHGSTYSRTSTSTPARDTSSAVRNRYAVVVSPTYSSPQLAQMSAGTPLITRTVELRFTVTVAVPGRVSPRLQITHSMAAAFAGSPAPKAWDLERHCTPRERA